jgi:type I restriction enzyme S subunit
VREDPLEAGHGQQRQLVAEVERQLSLIDAQAHAMDQALARSAALRRAILERAFTGRLVPQDPNDEPAGVLLERIHSEPPLPKNSRKRSGPPV